jgi:hypothetical protein|nr:MAG TPA: ATP dependent DNA helicase [Caudoviricetes sp.]
MSTCKVEFKGFNIDSGSLDNYLNQFTIDGKRKIDGAKNTISYLLSNAEDNKLGVLKLALNSNKAYIKDLANMMLNTNRKFYAEVEINNNLKGFSKYNANDNKIYINVDAISQRFSESAEEYLYERIVHDFIQGFANKELKKAYSDANRDSPYMRNIINLFKEYQNITDKKQYDLFKSSIEKEPLLDPRSERSLIREGFAEGTYRAITNPAEFLSYGLSSTQFRNTLRKQNLWQKFVSWLKDLLGISQDNNDLEYLYKNLDAYLKTEEEKSSIKVEQQGRYSVQDVRNNPDKIFVFGDNSIRQGTGGQAQIRNEPNAVGIMTKKFPRNTPDAFLYDSEYGENIKRINEDIENLKQKADGKTIVFPTDGIGTNLADIAHTAPATMRYLIDRLKSEFGLKDSDPFIKSMLNKLKEAEDFFGQKFLIDGKIYSYNKNTGDYFEHNFSGSGIGAKSFGTKINEQSLKDKILNEYNRVNKVSEQQTSSQEGSTEKYGEEFQVDQFIFSYNPETGKYYQHFKSKKGEVKELTNEKQQNKTFLKYIEKHPEHAEVITYENTGNEYVYDKQRDKVISLSTVETIVQPDIVDKVKNSKEHEHNKKIEELSNIIVQLLKKDYKTSTYQAYEYLKENGYGYIPEEIFTEAFVVAQEKTKKVNKDKVLDDIFENFAIDGSTNVFSLLESLNMKGFAKFKNNRIYIKFDGQINPIEYSLEDFYNKYLKLYNIKIDNKEDIHEQIILKNIEFDIKSRIKNFIDNDNYEDKSFESFIDNLHLNIGLTTSVGHSGGTIDTFAFESYTMSPFDIDYITIKPDKIRKIFNDIVSNLPKNENKFEFSYKGITIPTKFKLSEEQEQALITLIENITSGDTKPITLSGYAGSGKTSIIGYLEDYLKRKRGYKFLYGAPTHAATLYLGYNTKKMPFTIASSVVKRIDDFGNVTYTTSAKVDQALSDYDQNIFVVDEVSLMDSTTMDNFLSVMDRKGIKVIFMGDKMQLPEVASKGKINPETKNPIKDVSKAFTDFKLIQLSQVQRTKDNAILRVLTEIRNNPDGVLHVVDNTETLQFFNKDGNTKDFYGSFRRAFEKDPEETIYITYTNEDVKNFNKSFRKAFYGEDVDGLVEGESVIGYSGYNNKKIKSNDLANSIKYTVEDIRYDGSEVKITLKSNAVQKLADLHSPNRENDKTVQTTYLQMSRTDSLDMKNLTDEDFLKNNIRLSEIFRDVYDLKKRALGTNRWKDFSETLAKMTGGLAKLEIGDDYFYNPYTNMMEKESSVNWSKPEMANLKKNYKELFMSKSIDYGYGITIHKAQGATYKNVFFNATSTEFAKTEIHENGMQISTEGNSLNYVAMSRASEKLFVLHSNNIKRLNNDDSIELSKNCSVF